MTEPPARQGRIRLVEADAGAFDRSVSVVIPAYNEGEHIAEGVRELRAVLDQTDWSYEVLVVDDGSSDSTAEEAAKGGADVLRRRNNRGYGAALKLGISQAAHDWILITDADGTYPVVEIPRLLAEAEGQDMVVGARIGANVAIPLVRRPAKWFLTRLASYLAGRRLPDINSGLRLMRRPLVRRYEHLLPDGFSFTTTITLASTVNGHDVTYVPIDYHQRLGRSKIRPRHAFDFTLLIIRTIVFFNPLKIFLPLGALLATAGMAKFVFDITRNNLSESAILGVLSALVIWAVGLLADQNSRIAMKRN